MFSKAAILFILAHFGHHVLTAMLGPLLPLIRSEFSLNYAQSGFIMSAFILSYGIAQLPAGWLADRIDTRLLMTVGIAGVAACGLLVGLSPSFALMIIFLILMGIAGGGYHPSAPPLISATVKPENQGRVLGMHMIGGSASHFLAPLIGTAIAASLGWRGSFISIAIPMVIFGVVFYFLLRRWICPNEVNASSESPVSTGPVKTRRQRVVDLGTFIFLTTMTAAVLGSMVPFIPLLLTDIYEVAEDRAGAYLSLIFVAGFWAAPLGGYISDRIGRRKVVIACALLTALFIFLLPAVPFGIVFAIFLVVLGMFLFVRMPASEAYLLRNTPMKIRSTVLGIYYFGGMEGSGVLTPVLGGLIDARGFFGAFRIMGLGLAVITLLCGLVLVMNDRQIRKEVKGAEP